MNYLPHLRGPEYYREKNDYFWRACVTIDQPNNAFCDLIMRHQENANGE